MWTMFAVRRAALGVACLFAGMLIVGSGAVWAQETPPLEATEELFDLQSVTPQTWARVDGFARRADDVSTIESKFVRFAISHRAVGGDPAADRNAEYRRLKVWRPAQTGLSFAEVDTIDLGEGYAYMKMSPEPRRFRTSQMERAVLVLSDPGRYASIVRSWVAQELRSEQRVQEPVPDLARWFGHALRLIRERHRRQSLLDAMLNPERNDDPFARVPAPGPSFGDRVRRLNELEGLQDLEPAQLHEGAAIMLSIANDFTADHDVLRYMDLLYFPFMRSRRTVAGAEGTEVVVYTPHAPEPAPSGTGSSPPHTGVVWYFFLHSPTAQSIAIAGDWWDASTGTIQQMGLPYKLPLLHAVPVPVIRVQPALGDEPRWAINGNPENVLQAFSIAPNQTGPVDPLMTPELWQALHQAHADACDAGLEPKSPIVLAGDNVLECSEKPGMKDGAENGGNAP